MDAIETALAYRRRGWMPVPIPYRKKGPRIDDWPKLRLGEAEIKEQFDGRKLNVGIILGPASGNLVDIDLDCTEAIRLARFFLPPTDSIFGRESKPASHWIYSSNLATEKFLEPKSGVTLLEIRGNCTNGKAVQTVFPGSTHPGGETIDWVKNGDPLTVTPGSRLREAVAKLAAACLLARHFPPGPTGSEAGGRHEATLTLVAFLTRSNWDENSATRFVSAVLCGVGIDCYDAKVGELAANAAERSGDPSQPLRGFPKMAEIFGSEVAQKAARWLDIRPIGHDKQDTEQQPLNPFDPSTVISQMIPPRRWLVDQWVPEGKVTALYGDGGTGKSLLAQQLMTACALGHDWLGLKTTPGRAIGLFCEDDNDELKRRQEAINRAMTVEFHQLGDMRWISRTGDENLLMTFGQDNVGSLSSLWHRLREAAQGFAAKLIVIDTAADTFGGNENIRPQVRQFVSQALGGLCKDTGASVLLCAHPSLAGMANSSGSGGSTAWNNSVRSRLYLDRVKPDEGGDPAAIENLRTLHRKKANYSSAGAEALLRWQDGAFIAESVDDAATILGDMQHQAKMNRHEAAFLNALDAIIARGQAASDSVYSGVYAPKMMVGMKETKGMTKAEIEQAMKRLFNKGVIKADTVVGQTACRHPRRGIGRNLSVVD